MHQLWGTTLSAAARCHHCLLSHGRHRVGHQSGKEGLGKGEDTSVLLWTCWLGTADVQTGSRGRSKPRWAFPDVLGTVLWNHGVGCRAIPAVAGCAC